MAKSKVEPASEEQAVPAAPEPHPDVLAEHSAAGSIEELEQKVNALDKALTKRINDVRTDFTTLETTLTSKIQTNEAEIKRLKTQVSNNRASIDAMDADVKDAKKAGVAARQKADTVEQHLTETVEKQQQTNQQLDMKAAEARAHADELAANAHNELLQATSALTSRINDTEKSLQAEIKTVADAPVKPHKHSIRLDGESGPVTNGGNG